MFNIIGHKSIFLTISGLLALAAIVSIAVFGLKQGIDFVGGTQWQIKVPAVISELQKIYPEATVVEESSTKSFIIRAKTIDRELVKKLGAVEELSYEEIGPAIGSELRRKAIWAFIGVLLTISLYIALAFRKVSRPVSSWKYGLITLVTLFHDAIIPIGLLAYLGQSGLTELNTNIVVAVLVIMGFSVHDTIVVFDRIRENIKFAKNPSADFNGLVNKSVNETLVRSVNTSLTLIIVLLALLFLGAAGLTYFILTILIGVIVGTYSSIFVASPLLTLSAPKGKIQSQ